MVDYIQTFFHTPDKKQHHTNDHFSTFFNSFNCIPRSSRKYHLTEDEIEHEIKLCRKRATILRRSDGVKLILSLLTQKEINTVTAHGSDDSEVAGTECFHYHGSKQTSYNCRVIIVALQIVVFGKSNGKSTVRLKI